MANMKDFRNLSAKLRAMEKKYGEVHADVTVGYTQTYSLIVHENLTANFRVGQAKYLEQPAREMKQTFAQVITSAVKKGAKLLAALLMGGLRLQREAQKLTPVDTGALKASAFTCETKDVDAVSQAAFAKSETIRQAALSGKKKGKP